MLRAGAVIAGKYRVIRKLGEGAMGSVWLAKNETTDREFAIKVLLPDAAAAPDGLARFFREAKICGGLRHPSILEIYDAGPAPELGGAPFLVMERLDGAPLDVILRQRGALAPRLAIEIVAQLSRGLELAHKKSIVHRDLKPANVFLHRPGTGALVPKVLDFGISKMIDPRSPEIALTHSAAIMGSPLYMSPEQMDHDKPLDARSDVHALGLLLWECLVGTPPFAATSYNNLVVEIMKGPRPKLRAVMPLASEALADIVERAFALEREARFASAGDLANALDVELTHLGGGVLGGRTAAADLLSSLDLSSKPPPRMHGSTTDPLSVDAIRMSPVAQSVVVGSPSLASSPALAQTEEAHPLSAAIAPSPPVVAVSAQRTSPQPASRGRVPLLVGGLALVFLSIAGGTLWFARVKPQIAAAPPEAPIVASVVSVASASPSAAPVASVEPSATVTSSSAASPVAPTRSVARLSPTSVSSATAVAKKPTPSPLVPPTASTGRPRIGESGL